MSSLQLRSRLPASTGRNGATARSFLRDGAMTALLYVLLREWLAPVAKLAGAADPYAFLPIYIAVGFFLLIDFFRLPAAYGWVLKAVAILFATGWIYSNYSMPGVGWFAEYARTARSDATLVLGGEAAAVSVESRTLLFLVGWALMASVLHALVGVSSRLLWLAGVTSAYLLALQLWPGIDTSAGVVRAAAAGFALAALARLPALERQSSAAAGGRGWPGGWLLGSALLVTAAIAAGTIGAAGQSREPAAVDWSALPRPLADWMERAAAGFSEQKKTGYGNDDTRLGGPLAVDKGIVFTAKTKRPVYWRGESKNFYDGRGWSQRVSDETEPVPHAEAIRDAPAGSFVQEVWPSRPGAVPVMAGGFVVAAEKLSAASGRPAELRRHTDTGKLESSVPLTHYALRIVTDGPPPETLRQAGSDYPWDVRSAYFQLPASLPERVKSLAAAVAGEQQTGYDRAEAIAAYLRKNYTYSRDKAPIVKDGQDFVDQFLFEQKTGYCDHFSSAMVVLLRSIGIPARWVKGFGPGEVQSAGAATASTAGGPVDYTVTVRNADAHAWVEAYFPGAGWVAFEPTPGFGAGGVRPADIYSAAAGANAWALSADAGVLAAPRTAGAALAAALRSALRLLPAPALTPAVTLALAVTAGAALALAAAAWRSRQPLRLWLLLRLHGAVGGSPRALLLLDALWRCVFARFGRKAPQQTLREYVGALPPGASAAQRSALLRLLRLYERQRYGPLPPRLSGRKVAAVWRELRRKQSRGGADE